MRIVYVTDAMLPTPRAHGAQIVRNCEAFARVGADVTLLYQKVKGRSASISDYYGVRHEIKTVGIPGLEMPWLRRATAGRVGRLLLSGYRAAWETVTWMRLLRTSADLFIMRDSTSFLAWYLTKTNRPTLIEYHSPPRSLSRRLQKSAVGGRGMRAAVTVTKGLSETLARELNLDPESIRTLHDGVDLELFEVQGTEVSKPALASGKLTVLYVGSLLPNRGVGTLIDAAKLIPSIEITIVGGTEPELGATRDQAEKMGASNVQFVGHVQTRDVPDYLMQARVVVLPMTGTEAHTRLHASPMKLFEYMASGAAIVASDLPSIREVVEHGITAHLVEPDDPQALADGIAHVLGDDEYARRLGEAARDEVRKYTWDVRARAMLTAAGLSI